MTRTPPVKPRPTRDDDRFGPIEEADVPQAEVLEEYLTNDRISAEARFPVLHKIEEEATMTDLSGVEVVERGYSPSAAILRSRRPSKGLKDRRRRDAALASLVVAESGPPLPLLFAAVAVVVALAL